MLPSADPCHLYRNAWGKLGGSRTFAGIERSRGKSNNHQQAILGRRVNTSTTLTRTSTFLVTLRLECALTIFLTVARGYSFWPAAIAMGELLIYLGTGAGAGAGMRDFAGGLVGCLFSRCSLVRSKSKGFRQGGQLPSRMLPGAPVLVAAT